MTQWDKDYLELCKRILTEGEEVENRTGINTIKVPSHNFHFDLQKEFPILQTKQLFFRNAITEILWIYQVQSNNVNWLQERSNHVWDEWKVDKDGIYRIYDPKGKDFNKEVPLKDLNGDIIYSDNNEVKVKSLDGEKEIKDAKFYGDEFVDTIGTAYGWIVNKYKLTDKLLDAIKNNPTDRRMIMSLWQNEWLKTAVLPSCVWSSEWDVTNGKLNAWVHQRSCDVPLGLPFNVTQYATLLTLFAKVSNLEPGTLDWSIKDAHIYVNQVDGIKEQLNRQACYESYLNTSKDNLIRIRKYLLENKDYDPKSIVDKETLIKILDLLIESEKPYLWVNPDIDNFYDYDNSKELKDIKVKNYKHMGKIKFPLSQ